MTLLTLAATAFAADPSETAPLDAYLARRLEVVGEAPWSVVDAGGRPLSALQLAVAAGDDERAKTLRRRRDTNAAVAVALGLAGLGGGVASVALRAEPNTTYAVAGAAAVSLTAAGLFLGGATAGPGPSAKWTRDEAEALVQTYNAELRAELLP